MQAKIKMEITYKSPGGSGGGGGGEGGGDGDEDDEDDEGGGGGECVGASRFFVMCVTLHYITLHYIVCGMSYSTCHNTVGIEAVFVLSCSE